MKTSSLKKQLINGLAITVLTTSALGGVAIAATPSVSASTSAIQISEKTAVKKFQKTFKNSKVVEVQLEKKMGGYRYEISGRDDQQEHDLTINAKSGKIINKHSEQLDDDDQDTALDLSKLITRKQATKIAEKAAKSGKATSWDLSYENGTPVWEIEVSHGHQQHDVKINADNQKVISNEQDD
ncbi:PepSY domain-containing protein [uncultured Limosilactobacillus sp.]|uniref:PepSY domain-containing protein n=1 Tax=uncultured Limosilactobacillus sp. TaxID=2837629 RepID=UPI0025EC83F8|nr:PepSY domain-containing protein [uncultured Limosilactobacillus sp.]